MDANARSRPSGFQCHQCKETFRTAKLFTLHCANPCEKKKKPEKPVGKSHTCPICNSAFRSALALGKHISGTPGFGDCVANKDDERNTRKRKQNANEGISRRHSMYRRQLEGEKQRNQAQDRAVTYDSECLWTRPNRDQQVKSLLNARRAPTTPAAVGAPGPAEPGPASPAPEGEEDFGSSDGGDPFDVQPNLHESDVSSDDDDEDDDEDDAWEDVGDWCGGDEEEDETVERDDRWIPLRYGHGRGFRWNKPFEYKGNLPPLYIAQISLLKILSEHKGNDLGLFDRIMAWACHFSDKYPSIWKTRKLYAHRKRKTILRYLAKYLRMDNLYPEPVTVECERVKLNSRKTNLYVWTMTCH